MTYSALDRFHDALKGKPRDHVPLFPLIAGWAIKQFANLPIPEVENNPKEIANTHLRAQEEVGYDILPCYANALSIPGAFGCNIRYPSTGAIADPLSLKITSHDDLDKISIPDPEHSGRLPETFEVIHCLKEKNHHDAPLLAVSEGAFTTTCRINEPDLIMRMIVKNPPVLETLLDRINGFLIKFASALQKAGANVLFIAEPTSSSSMISPVMFRELVLPRLQQLIASLNIPCILHICGDTNPILPIMAECGADVLSLDQCMDLSESRRSFPNEVLGGNVDPIQSLLMGSKEQVIKNTFQCLEAAGTSRYVLMSGCGVPPDTSVENVKAMIQTARDYGLG
jgi:MtaA/CmuA family methyltransferase